jgi:thymidine phosphorylase
MARFEALAEAQGGRLAAFDRAWPRGVDLPADRSGIVAAIDSRRIGETVARAKGNVAPAEARRLGVRLHRRRGDRIGRGEALMTCWLPEGADGLRDAIDVADAAPASSRLVVEIARSDDPS